jgi:hypothetical protein
VLLIGPAGQLFVRDEVGDSETVDIHKATFAKEPPAGGGFGGEMGGRGGMMGPGGMGPGGMGGRGGR